MSANLTGNDSIPSHIATAKLRILFLSMLILPFTFSGWRDIWQGKGFDFESPYFLLFGFFGSLQVIFLWRLIRGGPVYVLSEHGIRHRGWKKELPWSEIMWVGGYESRFRLGGRSILVMVANRGNNADTFGGLWGLLLKLELRLTNPDGYPLQLTLNDAKVDGRKFHMHMTEKVNEHRNRRS